MRRILARALVAITVLLGVTVIASPAYADSFQWSWPQIGGTDASVSYSFNWNNRSVAIGGDIVGPNDAQVKFDFYQGSVFLDEQTRTVMNDVQILPFGWTEPGPQGGITVIRVFLCYHSSCSPDIHYYNRP